MLCNWIRIKNKIIQKFSYIQIYTNIDQIQDQDVQAIMAMNKTYIEV